MPNEDLIITEAIDYAGSHPHATVLIASADGYRLAQLRLASHPSVVSLVRSAWYLGNQSKIIFHLCKSMDDFQGIRKMHAQHVLIDSAGQPGDDVKAALAGLLLPGEEDVSRKPEGAPVTI